MREMREAVESSSPSGQGVESPRGGFFERRMLRRISSLASSLPEEFEESGRAGTLRVFGITSEDSTNIKVTEKLPQEADGAIRFTEIDLVRSSIDPRVLTSLTAERYIADEVAELHGFKSPQQTYELGAASNTLSLFRVMRSVSLATRTLENARTLEYLSRPESSMPQMF